MNGLSEEALFFPSGQDWRNWLTLNHTGKDHIWLIFYKKNSDKNGISLSEAVEEAINFGWIDGQLCRRDTESYRIRFSPRRTGSVWSKINKERAEKLIANGKMTSSGLAKIEEAKKTGTWNNAYTNKIRDEIPVDLRNALMIDRTAFDNFQKFANTYRNMYIGYVNSAKSFETRKRRINKVVLQSLHNKKQIFVTGSA